MTRRAIILLLLLAAVLLTAFTYPLKKISLTSTFGETRVDHLHNGIDLSGDSAEVRSVLAGQVIFSWDEADFPLDQPLGYGNFVILQHGDSFRSYYYHLKSGSVPRGLVYVNEGIVIGRVGNSGHSGGSHLHFSIFDLKEGKLLNPLAFMRDVPDSRRPSAGKVFYSLGRDGEVLPLTAATVLTQGRPVELYLKTFDSIQSSPFMLGVYSIEVRTNSGLFYSIVFDSLSIIPPAGVVAKDSLRYSEVYAKPYLYRLGRLTPVTGMTLAVRVADYAKNSDSVRVPVRTVPRE
jgi:murein DD-endopeptidase MepM/ murein hydrolase activator NlpD